MAHNKPIIYERLQILPTAARSLVYVHNGWIVGGSTKFLLGISNVIPNDIDILVPFYEWGKACLIVPKGTPSNSFGGHKLIQQPATYQAQNFLFDIDMWCGDIGWYLCNTKLFDCNHAIHISSNTVIFRYSGIVKVRG